MAYSGKYVVLQFEFFEKNNQCKFYLTLMMASAQVVETSVNTNNSPSQDYTTNPDDHSNHNVNFIIPGRNRASVF